MLLPQAFRGLAQQFAVAPTVTLTLGSLPPARLKLASGLFNLMRNLGGAIGIALCGTVLNDRTNLHYSRLADHLNNANLAMSDFVQRSAANFTVQDLAGCRADGGAEKSFRAGATGGANPCIFRCFLPHHDGFFTCRAAGSLDEKAAGTLILQES